MWEGKCREELGDLRTALEIYDEVSTVDPASGLGEKQRMRLDAELTPLFAQLDYFRFLILAKQKPGGFLVEGERWLKFYRNRKTTDGFQGVALAIVEAKLTAAENGCDSDKDRAKQEAITVLREMVGVPSTHRRRAAHLLSCSSRLTSSP